MPRSANVQLRVDSLNVLCCEKVLYPTYVGNQRISPYHIHGNSKDVFTVVNDYGMAERRPEATTILPMHNADLDPRNFSSDPKNV